MKLEWRAHEKDGKTWGLVAGIKERAIAFSILPKTKSRWVLLITVPFSPEMQLFGEGLSINRVIINHGVVMLSCSYGTEATCKAKADIFLRQNNGFHSPSGKS